MGYIKCREGGFNFHGETPQGFGWNEGLTREYRVSPLVPVLRERRFRNGSATMPPPVGEPLQVFSRPPVAVAFEGHHEFHRQAL